ncbi:cytochrome c oxidase assembly protein [Noviherbaspirillum sp. CPCC 100848]|uniref:Cytochrome c oxidase assembly protein n=1 Tax=Noviherbaspirillum album TaxID=3080276 RepID=A0ABU6JIY3_9BURK|nr:cytochrome c oxidase assembly protein [Noviherbaspirillum sp. CPCC 100848]MEC4723117.1 cytochrome c oxidase assembly protein [Noviherbaspirillum sp. CPCC 100848]
MLAATCLYFIGLLRVRGHNRLAPSLHRIISFWLGLAALFFALIWPFDVLGSISFAAHMSQHMLLIAVGAPLLALARPVPLLIAGLPRPLRQLHRWSGFLYRIRSPMNRPATAFSLHAFIIWVWHSPVLFELALHHAWIHVAEHLCFLVSGLLFWGSIQRNCGVDGKGYGMAILWLLATIMHTGLLGALLTFSPKVLYNFYQAGNHAFLTPLEDQQLAGLVMWIPGGLCYLVAALSYAAAWLQLGLREDGSKTMS